MTKTEILNRMSRLTSELEHPREGVDQVIRIVKFLRGRAPIGSIPRLPAYVLK